MVRLNGSGCLMEDPDRAGADDTSGAQLRKLATFSPQLVRMIPEDKSVPILGEMYADGGHGVGALPVILGVQTVAGPDASYFNVAGHIRPIRGGFNDGVRFQKAAPTQPINHST